jgi:hypothetical protein
MNDFVLNQLKIIVERAVRPVQASIARKRKMREELLAHVTGVFEEESARLGDERLAIEQTSQRFGNTAEVTGQLQQSVPAGDWFRRWWEGRPEETSLRAGVRIAGVTTLLALVVFLIALWVGGWASAWPAEALLVAGLAVLSLPAYLLGLAALAHLMESSLRGPAPYLLPADRVLRVKVTLIELCSCLFMMLWVAGLSWPNWIADWDYASAVLLTGWLAPMAILMPYSLAQSAALRRRYHDKWANLPIHDKNGAPA